MHVLIAKRMGILGQVDHKDRDRLNNQRENLRSGTSAQNNQNRSKVDGKSSKFKGVSYYAPTDRWKATIYRDKKWYYLGYFLSEIEAALAYDVEAKRLFGEFAVLNFPKV